MMKIFSTIFYTIFIAMVVGIAGLLLGTMLPIPGNIEMKIVKSGSMEPSIPTGSIVVVKPAAEYNFNDIITFGEDTKTQIPTTHRIVGIQGTGMTATYTTKGDANEEADEGSVMRKEIIGKVVLHVPYAGFVLDFARQPLGFALLVAIPAALVIFEELLTIFRETRKWWSGTSRKRDGTDDRDSGRGGGGMSVSEKTLDLRGAPQIVYRQRRMMDEVLVPMLQRMQDDFRERLKTRPAPQMIPTHADAYGVSTALVVSLVFTSMFFTSASGGTVAYFQDIEHSLGNVLQAGEWEPEEQLVEPFAALSLVSDQGIPEGAVLGEATSTESSTSTSSGGLPAQAGGSSGPTPPCTENCEQASSTDSLPQTPEDEETNVPETPVEAPTEQTPGETPTDEPEPEGVPQVPQGIPDPEPEQESVSEAEEPGAN